MGTQLALTDEELDALAECIPRATSDELAEIERLLGITVTADDEPSTPPLPLYEFVQQAWSHVEPSVPFIRAWHLELICEHLEAISIGRLEQDLLINIPFGCCKSLSVGLFWPCWEWTFRPSTRWLFASYNRSRSIELSKTRRDLLKSTWYQSRWGHRVQLDREASSKSRYRNTRKGQMFATGIGGALGEHPDRIVVDDPSDADSIHSAVQREQVTSWWDNAIIGRGVLRGARKVVIMQRLHEQDLSGRILKQGGFVHICLPWEFEPGRMVPTPLSASDRRTRPGELLWEAARHAIERVRRTMSPHVQAGQLQQRPSSPQGEFFKRTWFGDRFIERTEVPRGPVKDDRALYRGRACRYWDRGGSLTGDYTAGVLLLECDKLWYVVDVVRGKWEQHQRDQIIVETAKRDALLCPDYVIGLEREPGSAGKDMNSLLTRSLAGFRVRDDRPTGPKHVRADAWASQLSAGNVRIVRDTAEKRWNADFIDEHCAFRVDDTHAHDDVVDAAAGAFRILQNSRTVSLMDMVKRI